ncbi:MAG: toxin ParE1/3/4 [Methyloprofundus sp.]|nr:MAG: toxin ParE1/3/4 [Methyloprofundus sp.]
MADFKLNKAAEEDLEHIYEYGIISFGLKQADDYYDGLIDHFHKLADNPYLWQTVDSIRAGYRRSIYTGESVYYRIDGETVEIMRILGSQDVTKEIE